MSRSLELRGDRSLSINRGHNRPELRSLKPKTRSLRWIGVLLVVALPTLLATAYYGFLATDRYVSTAKLTVRSADQGPSAGGLGGVLSGVVNSGSNQTQAYVVEEYIKSQRMLTQLQEWLDLRAHWSDPNIDRLSRLDKNASTVELHNYYQSMISTNYVQERGVIHLEVQGYSAEDANALATSIIALSETLVNRMSDGIQEDAVAFAKDEVERAEKRLQEARLAVKRFQNEHGELDPEARAEAIGGIVSELEKRLANVRADITAKSTFMRKDSAAMEALQAEKDALEEQLKREKQRLAGRGSQAPGGETYSDLLAEYEELRIEEEFARKGYELAQNTLEKARIEASRKQMYLIDFVEPSMPDEPTKPDRLRNILIAFFGSIIGFTIVTLLVGAIREHAKI